MGALLSDWNTVIDPQTDFKLFYDGIWNILTAAGYGLDVWGRIVGVSRNLKVGIAFGFFGFAEVFGPEGFAETGEGGSFYSGTPSGTTPITLGDSAFRKLILLKALSNVSNCSAYSLNAVLNSLYSGEGASYALDLGGMRFELVFHFALTPQDEAILTQSGTFLRPAGTAYEIVQEP